MSDRLAQDITAPVIRLHSETTDAERKAHFQRVLDLLTEAQPETTIVLCYKHENSQVVGRSFIAGSFELDVFERWMKDFELLYKRTLDQYANAAKQAIREGKINRFSIENTTAI